VKRNAPLPCGLLSALILLFALRAEAHAHTAMPGGNHFMGGILHPLTAPAHVLILIGLGIALGQHLPFKPRLPMLAFASFAAIGLALTMAFPFAMPQPVLIGIALCAGALVALEKKLPPVANAALFAAGALAMGLDSGIEKGGISVAIRTLLGTLSGLVVFLFGIAFYASLAAAQHKKWLHIGLRVIGSWIAAIALLMLAFALRK
jgi:hydrogenase/urease accessory protein HupE